MKERIAYFDTYRFIAAMMIFLTHFISAFSKASFRYFHMLPYSLVLEAVRGSLGVQMLCVVLGYFAYRKGEHSKDSIIMLGLKRYIYFVVIAAIYYATTLSIGWLNIKGGFFHITKELTKATVLLTDEYNGLFWTLIPMLIGSLLCYILGRSQMKTGGIIVLACAILLLKNPWVFNCVIGSFVAVWQDDKLVSKVMCRWYVQLPVIIITLSAISTDHESSLLYVLQGIFCVAVLVVTMNNKKLAKIMGAPILTKFNRGYFSLFIFHSPLYRHLGRALMYMDGFMSYKVRFILVFLLITLVSVLLSKPLNAVVGLITKHIYNLLEKAERNYNKLMLKIEVS